MLTTMSTFLIVERGNYLRLLGHFRKKDVK